MKKLIILFLLLPSLLFSQVSPSKIVRIADAATVFGTALSYGTYLEMQSNNKTYKIININGTAGSAKFTDLVLNSDYIEEGTVTAVSTAAANNGVTATWSMASPTPALTIGLGAITPSSVNGLTLTALATGFTVGGGTTSKTLTVPLDASVSGTNTGDNAANSSSTFIGTTSVALNRASGALTLAGLTLTTPDIGVATATAINKVTLTAPTTSATLTLIDGSSLITSGAFATTLTSTATSNATIPAGTNTLYSTLASSITSAQMLTSISDETGTGAAVFGTSPTLATPIINGTITGTTVIPVVNGGTGQSSYTNGQLLIGNTTGNTLDKNTLTAGSGISITNGAGSITVGGIASTKTTTYSSGSGTFTTDANCIYAQIIVVGGGGGGGAADSDGSSSSAAGGGGGGGAAISYYITDERGATAAYAIGAAGAAGSGNGGTGGTGGSSTFNPVGTGATLTGAGGAGGVGTGSAYGNTWAAFTGGAGGSGTNGQINQTGIDGSTGFGAAGPAVAAGNGGASYLGGGANGPVRTTAGVTAGVAATISGAGGSGACNTNSTTSQNGGAGMTGTIIIIEFLK
ncbi:MAG: hypothetical protein K8R85_16915 [Bacteroidetes bacterium]|nr:hypothetical protein [Bacteroidota bacterium]